MTFWVAGAVVGSAVVGGIASNKAASKQVDAARDANSEQAREYDQTRKDQLDLLAQQRADQAPWLDAGKNALASIMSGIGNGGEFTKRFSLADFAADPGYQFRLDQGTQGIQRAAAAHGGLYSGATLKALARFNQDTASQEYGNAYNRYVSDQGGKFNRLAAIAGLGQTATNQVGQAGQSAYGTIASAGANMAGNIGQNLIGAGNARASGYVGAANALTNGLGQYLNYSQNQSLLSRLASGNGYTPFNRYSGGNDGYTLPNGESYPS